MVLDTLHCVYWIEIHCECSFFRSACVGLDIIQYIKTDEINCCLMMMRCSQPSKHNSQSRTAPLFPERALKSNGEMQSSMIILKQYISICAICSCPNPLVAWEWGCTFLCWPIAIQLNLWCPENDASWRIRKPLLPNIGNRMTVVLLHHSSLQGLVTTPTSRNLAEIWQKST